MSEKEEKEEKEDHEDYHNVFLSIEDTLKIIEKKPPNEKIIQFYLEKENQEKNSKKE